MQHLAKEVSSIKEEQSKAIELRNRKVDTTAKPKEVKRPKTSKAGDNPTKETIEGGDTIEEKPSGRMEPSTEPIIRDSPEVVPTSPSVNTT
ncbi:hypothetical protein A2U01_0065595, partial [Trifolium medium]|nr:hypothetical protein [Trifolium medium]